MKTPFFITGLPRSRTAWLANLFTTADILCHHEPIQHFQKLIRDNPGGRTGFSDSTLAFYFDLIVKEYPCAPWIYVRRDPAAALASFEKFVGSVVEVPKAKGEEFFHKLRDKLETISEAANVLTVDFEDLWQPEVISKVWSWCVSEPFNAQRARLLQGLRVQQMLVPAMKERGMI